MTTDFQPYDYQKYAIDKILDNKKYGLFLDMGLGKTVSTLTAIDELMFNAFEIEKVLVIAPKYVAEHTWAQEAKKWSHLSHLTFSLVMGTPKQRRSALNKEADIYVTNKENTKWLCDEFKMRCRSTCWLLMNFRHLRAMTVRGLKLLNVRCRYLTGSSG